MRITPPLASFLRASKSNITMAVLAAVCSSPVFAQTNGNWNANSAGNWSDATKWSSNPAVPGGATSTVGLTFDIGTNRTVMIDTTSRTVGTLNIGDTNNTHSYTLAANGGASLIFDNSSSGAQLNQLSTSRGDIVSAPISLLDDLTVSNAADTYTLLLSGSSITGANNLTLNTNGTGAINVTAASVNNGGTITNSGSGSGTVTIQTGVIGTNVTGVVQDSATSQLTLIGNNTFSTGVTIKKGVVAIGGSVNALGTGAVTIGDSSGGSNVATLLSLNGLTYANAIMLASTTTGPLSIGTTTTANTVFSGGVTGSNNLTFGSTETGTLTFSTASVNNAGTITNASAGSGTVTLSGGVGSNVTGITQNSTTSALTVSGGLAVNSLGTTLTNTAGTKLLTLSGGVTGTGDLVLNNNSALANGITLSTAAANHTGTITNSGTGSGNTIISAALGSAVTNLTQNSASSSLTLSGTNTDFAGTTTLSSGTLRLGSATALGGNGLATGTGGALSIAAGSTLDVTAAQTLSTVNAQNWNGSFTFGGTNTLNTGTGAVSLGVSSFQLTNSGANTLTVGGGVTGTSDVTLTANAAGGFTFAGGLNNVGTITNNGAGTGTVTLSGGVGSNVTGITQNSTTSATTVSGAQNVNSSGTTLTNTAGTKLLTISGGVTGTGNLVLNNNSALANGITLSTAAVNHTGGITNTGAGSGASLISAAIGTNVTGVVQDSATSSLTLSGANTFSTGVTIKKGTLLVNTSASALGTGTVLLGDTSGSADATLAINSGSTVLYTNPITVQAGSSGVLTILASGNSAAARPNGNILLNNSLTIAADGTNRSGSNAGAFFSTSGTISGTGNLSLNVSGGLYTTNNTNQPQADSLTLTGGVTTFGSINNVGTGAGRAGISGDITNASSLNQNSATSMLSLSGTNSYSGSTNVTAGVLRLTANSALSSNSPSVNVASGGTLQLQATITNVGQTLNLSGYGNSYSYGALDSTNNASYGGSIVLLNDAAVSSDLATTTFALSGSITGSGKNLTTAGVGNVSISNSIGTGAGGLTKLGTGVLTLSGSNAYAGLTRISGGFLSVDSANALGGGGNITFDGGAIRHNATNVLDYGSRIVNSTGPISIDSNGTTTASYSGIGSSNTGGLAKLGTGKLTLAGTNGFTGPIAINAGSLTVSATSAIPSVGTGQIFIDKNGASNTGGAYSTLGTWLSSGDIASGSTGVIAITGANSDNINFAGYGNLGLGASTNGTYSGTITTTGGTYRLGGGGATLTINTTNALTGADTLITNGAVLLGGANNLSGATTVSSNTLTLNGANGNLASSAITVSPGATLAVTTSTAGPAVTRAASATLNRGTLSVIGNNTANSSDTITGALTIGSGGNSTVTVNANGSRNALLNAGNFGRTAGGTALFRGQDLGVSPLGAPVNGDANLNFTTPNLVGAGGTGTDRSIFVGVVGDVSVTGNGFGATGGLLTQDATNGVRRLAGADYKDSIGDGQTDLDNVQLTSTGATATTTLALATTINSLSLNSTTAAGANVQVTGAGTLKLNSGVIYANSVTTTTASAISNTIDFNGREGVVLAGGTADLTLSGVLSNTGGNGLTFYGNRNVNLSGGAANTYTGTTTVNGGTLTLNKTAVTAITGDLLLNAGTVTESASNQIADGANISVNSGTLNFLAETFNNLTMTGGTANTGGVLNVNGSMSLSGGSSVLVGVSDTLNVLGATNLSDNGSIRLLRSQNVNGSYDTVTTLTALNITNTTSGVYTAITIDHGSGLGQSGGKLVLDGDVTFTGNATNTNTVLIDAIQGSGRQGVIELTDTAGNRIFDIGNGAAANDLSITAALLDGAGGASGLTKNGFGTLVLTGDNTYTGPTKVNKGTLVINGNSSTSTGSVSVAEGATLGGTGTIAGAVTFAPPTETPTGAIHSPGNSVGKQSFANNVTYSDGSIFEWELGAALKDSNTRGSVRGTDWDAVNVSGTLSGLDDAGDDNSTTDAIFRIVLPRTTDFAEAFWNQNHQWTDIFKDSDDGSSLDFASIFNGGFQYFNYSGTNGSRVDLGEPTLGYFSASGSTLSWNAVPETTSALAGLLLAAGLLRRRRA